MAGYLMNLDSQASLRSCLVDGVYSTRMSSPEKGRWAGHHEATFADYVTMKPGDNIYFFIDRKIYGIGELVKVGHSCRYLNYPNASRPENPTYSDIKEQLLDDNSDASPSHRWVCLFRPAPLFFMNGIDMDDMLASNPKAFRMLRVFWKLSFLKFDDLENQAFKSALLKANEAILTRPQLAERTFKSSCESKHKAIKAKLGPAYRFDASPFLAGCSEGTALKHEMAVELGLLDQLSSHHSATEKVFGRWDYLHHQVVASPFKPVDYMDKMDVFGYSFIPGYEPTKSRYLVVELKKDTAESADIEQALKYVDWVKDEYTFGDYSMIRAFLVAHEFTDEAIAAKDALASRRHIVGRRPAVSKEWRDLQLVAYKFNSKTNRLDFATV